MQSPVLESKEKQQNTSQSDKEFLECLKYTLSAEEIRKTPIAELWRRFRAT